jgi:hypothetical protein
VNCLHGGRSIVENNKGAQIVMDLIQGIYAKKLIKNNFIFTNYTVQNIVGSFHVPYKIDLISLNRVKSKISVYDFSIFHGLKFNPFTSVRTTILIFTSDKFAVTGVKTL